jgi:hypothetical protein
MTWLKFLALLMPTLHELARELYHRHSGNVAASKSELQVIRNHGGQLKEFEAEIQRRLASLRGRPERSEPKS